MSKSEPALEVRRLDPYRWLIPRQGAMLVEGLIFADGRLMEQIRRLLSIAPDWLAPGGLILLEIEASQGPRALSLAFDAFHAASIELRQDLAGRDRLLTIQLPEE